MYVRVYCASAALEVPLKQERGVGGGRVDLSLQRGGCDVAVENGRGGTDCVSWP